MKSFPLHVETMSRAEIITAYFDAVAAYEDVTGSKEEFHQTIDLIRQIPQNPIKGKCDNGSPNSEARALTALKRGRVVSNQALGQLIRDAAFSEASEAHLINHAKVIISHLRRRLNRVGIKIETLWGVGYILRPDEIAKVNYLIGRCAAGQDIILVDKG